MINKLATSQIEIYWKHDSGDFIAVSELAKNIYVTLGFNEEISREAGDYISDAYRLADTAELARREGNKKIECETYIKACEKLVRTENALGYYISTAENQVKWWRYFRHRNILFAFINLFIQHAKPLGVKRFHIALFMTIILTKVGLAHNKRNKTLAVYEAEKYWKLMIKEGTRGCPYIG